MNQVTICENALEPSTWQEYNDISDVSKFLFEHFGGKWPGTARIYLDRVAKVSDITPFDDAGISRLAKANGHFWIVVYPEGIETILIIVAIAVAAISIGLTFLLRPSSPKKNQQADSQNNQLGNRENKARPNARIPDIFGQVWATFDLLAVPYLTFIDNVEYEHCYFCIGRGEYDIATVTIRDGITPLQQISGASAQVYGPNKNPNIPSTPDIQIGDNFVEEVVNLQVFGAVDNQLLQAPNVSAFDQINYPGPVLRFRYPNIIETNTGADLTTAFQSGDTIYLGGQVANDDIASDPGAVHAAVHLGGIYSVASVSSTQVFLDSPATINANWAALNAFTGSVSNFESDSIMANNPLWIGGNSALIPPVPAFFLNYPDMTEVWCNFVAPSGAYKIDSSTQEQTAIDIIIEVGIRPCDSTGSPTGLENFFSVTLKGSHTDRQAKGGTLKILVTPGTGGVLVRAHRKSLGIITPNFQAAEQVTWRDCYIITPVCIGGFIDFGDITTVQTLIRATPGAVAISQRKLNALVTRKVQVPSGGSLAPSTNAADILCAMALDPSIGNLQANDLDITEIYAVAGAGGDIETYFTPSTDPTLLNQFSYTFDDETISFEEMAVELATAIFSIAFRRGGKLSLSFEKATSNSTLLFNHRNKVPKSETKTITFGTSTNNDGIILDYIEPNAPNYPNQDTTVSLYFPPTLSAKNPKKITSIGVRNLKQAMTMGWRLYWKLLAQNTIVQFDGTEESALLVQQDRILVADNTRSDTQDGEVTNQVSLLLTLSQNVVFLGGHTYSIYLQHPDATVENIGITAGPNPNQVVLATAPTLPCVIDPTKYARTTYMIVSDAVTQSAAFLVSEKTPKSGKIYEVKAVNYSDAYYQHDQDIVVASAPVYSPCLAPAVLAVIYDNNIAATGFAGLREVDSFGGINYLPLSSADSVVLTRFGSTLHSFQVNRMASDSAGNIYAACANHIIVKITPGGVITHIAGTAAGNTQGGLSGSASTTALDTTSSIAIDAAGNLYIVCRNGTNGPNILAINMQGTTQTLLGVSIAAGCIDNVAGIRGSAGNTGDGGAANSAVFGGSIGGIVCDPSGNLIVVDSTNNRIRLVDHSSGVISNLCGSSAGTQGNSGYGGSATSVLLAFPIGACCDAAGNVYIGSDAQTVLGLTRRTVLAINTQGGTQTLFGVSIAAGHADVVAGVFNSTGYSGDNGPATSAHIEGGAIFVGIDSVGNLYIADGTNATIRKVDSSGLITILAGTPSTNGNSGDGGLAVGAKLDNSGFVVITG